MSKIKGPDVFVQVRAARAQSGEEVGIQRQAGLGAGLALGELVCIKSIISQADKRVLRIQFDFEDSLLLVDLSREKGRKFILHAPDRNHNTEVIESS